MTSGVFKTHKCLQLHFQFSDFSAEQTKRLRSKTSTVFFPTLFIHLKNKTQTLTQLRPSLDSRSVAQHPTRPKMNITTLMPMTMAAGISVCLS